MGGPGGGCGSCGLCHIAGEGNYGSYPIGEGAYVIPYPIYRHAEERIPSGPSSVPVMPAKPAGYPYVDAILLDLLYLRGFFFSFFGFIAFLDFVGGITVLYANAIVVLKIKLINVRTRKKRYE
jgi:hypothetical protein